MTGAMHAQKKTRGDLLSTCVSAQVFFGVPLIFITSGKQNGSAYTPPN